MIHTNGLHGRREKGSQNRENTSLSPCNGTRTLPPNSSLDSDVHHSTKDKHARRKEKNDAVGYEKDTCVKDGEDLAHVMSDDVAHDRTPAMCDRGSNDDITAMMHTRPKEPLSPGGKWAKGTVRGFCNVGGSTESSDTKKAAAESSPNGHGYSSPPKLEKETSPPKYSNNECSPPKISTKCESSAATEIGRNNTPENCSDLAESRKQVCAGDKEEDRQKPIDHVVRTNETESSMKSVDAPKGNSCHDDAGDQRGSTCDVDLHVKSIDKNRSSKKKVKDSRDDSLSLLIERMQGNISRVTPNEESDDSDESESIDDESDVNSSGSSESDDSSSEEDDTDEEEEEEEDREAGNVADSSGTELCPVEGKVSSGHESDRPGSEVNCLSDQHKDKAREEQSCTSTHRDDDDDIDGPSPTSSTADVPHADGPLPDKSEGPDDGGIPLNDEGPQATVLPVNDVHPSSGKTEESKVEPLTDGGIVEGCDDFETVESDDSTMMTEKETLDLSEHSSVLQIETTSPATHVQKDLFADTASTSNLSADIGSREDARSGHSNENVYSLFEKPAPLTKKRAAAFASTDLDRYLAKHSDLQQPLLPKGDKAESSGKTNVTLEKDVTEIDGITFTSFPTREMLRTHIAQEKQRVRYIDTATMLQQKWGSEDTKTEPAPVNANASSGWQKTDDVRKIKGWKKRLLSTDADAASAVEVTVSCKSERLHWRSEEKLVKMLTPEQLKDMGLKLKHKRRRHTPYTQSKHHVTSDQSMVSLTDASHDQQRHSVNYGDTELKGAADRNPYVIKIFGRKSDGKFAPKRKTDESRSNRKKQKVYSGLLSGSPASVHKFQTMLDRKNLSVGLSSKFCSDLETSHKFRIIDNQLIASEGDSDAWVTVAHQRLESDASELPESLRRLEAVMLTHPMVLAAVTTVQQPPRVPCKKPGCRYSCVCHLCDVMSADDGDAIDFDPVTIKTCDKEYCRLGCICDTADSTSGGSMGNQGCSLLDTSIDSSFDNTCSFVDDDADATSSHNTSSDAVDTKNRNSTGSMAQKRHNSGGHDRGGKIKKRSSTGDIPIIPREGFSQELAALLLPEAATGSVATATATKTEVTAAPPSVRKSSRLKDKCGIGIVDRLRSLIYFDTAFWLQDDKPRKKKPKQQKPPPQQQKQQQPEQQQPQQELQYSRVKSLVRNSTMTSHQENITTVELSSGDDDDDELVPKPSSKRQRYKLETDRAAASAATSSSYRSFTKTLSSPQQTPPTPSTPCTPGFTTQMVVLERNSKLNTFPRQARALPHLLEIESDCNWQNGRYKILSDIARLADSTSGYPQPVAFRVDQFFVRILEKSNQMTNIPPHLQKTLKTKQMFAVRVQITEVSDDKRYNSIPSNAAEELPTFSDYCAETDRGKMGNCESGFSAVLTSPYAPRRSAQVEEARQALEQARKALTTELEKVKREREESFEGSVIEPTSDVGANVKEEADEMTTPPLDDAVKVEGRSLLKSSLLRSVPTLVPAPHVRSPRQPVVPVAVVPNVAHSLQFNNGMADMTCPGGYDGCDDPVTEVAYDASCQDELDAAALSSIDDLLMTDDSSSLENTNGTLEDSSSGISSSIKSEGDTESGDYIDPVGGVENTTRMSHEGRKKSKLVLSDHLGDHKEKNAVKVTKERVRRGQLSVKFEKLRKLLLPLEIPGQKLSKQLILSTAVKTVHNVSKANKRWLDLKRRELQRQAELTQRLNQLRALEMTMPRGAKASQQEAPPKHRELSQRVDVDADVYAVSSESSNDEDASAVLS